MFKWNLKDHRKMSTDDWLPFNTARLYTANIAVRDTEERCKCNGTTQKWRMYASVALNFFLKFSSSTNVNATFECKFALGAKHVCWNVPRVLIFFLVLKYKYTILASINLIAIKLVATVEKLTFSILIIRSSHSSFEFLWDGFRMDLLNFFFSPRKFFTRQWKGRFYNYI